MISINGDVGIWDASGRQYLHQNSETPAILNIADVIGNTGKPGQWAFRADNLNATATVTRLTATTTTPVLSGISTGV